MHTNFVQAGEVKLQYFEQGTGPELLVLIHGYAASGRIWRLTQEAFPDDQFRTLAFSNRGAGDSDHTESEDGYSIPSLANDLHEAVATLGLGPFTLVGHSMGGATVVQYALDHPQLVKALVLLDSTSLDGGPMQPGWEEEIRQAYGKDAAPRTPRTASMEQPAPDEFRQAMRDDVARNPLARLIGSQRSMGELRLRHRLAHLRMPVLAVGADQDATIGIETILTDFLALSPRYRSLHIFHGVGHSPNVGVAPALVEVLKAFIIKP